MSYVETYGMPFYIGRHIGRRTMEKMGGRLFGGVCYFCDPTDYRKPSPWTVFKKVRTYRKSKGYVHVYACIRCGETNEIHSTHRRVNVVKDIGS